MGMQRGNISRQRSNNALLSAWRFGQRINTETFSRDRAGENASDEWCIGVRFCIPPKCREISASKNSADDLYSLLDVIRCKTNSCRTLMTALVPRAIPAFSKVSAAP